MSRNNIPTVLYEPMELTKELVPSELYGLTSCLDFVLVSFHLSAMTFVSHVTCDITRYTVTRE